MTIVCNIWMICLELNWLFYDQSRMLQLSELVWTPALTSFSSLFFIPLHLSLFTPISFCLFTPPYPLSILSIYPYSPPPYSSPPILIHPLPTPLHLSLFTLSLPPLHLSLFTSSLPPLHLIHLLPTPSFLIK